MTKYNGAPYGFNGCPYGFANEAGGAPALADILASVGTSTSPVSIGLSSVSGIPFLPKAVLTSSTTTSVATSTDILFVLGGATSASSQFSVSASSQNAVTTSVTYRRHIADTISSCLRANGSTRSVAKLASIESDGFTYNWTDVGASNSVLNHIALGGADLERSITQHQMNGTYADQSFAHGLSEAPTALLFVSAMNATAPANTESSLFYSQGAWAGGGQWSASLYSNNGVTTTSTRRMLCNDSVLSLIGTSRTRSMAVSSVDATNVNVTYPITSSDYQAYFWMIALRGCTAKVGTFDCNGSLDPLTIDCAGVRPKLFLPVFVPQGVDSVNTVLSDLLLSVGASDGTNNVSCGITDQNGVTTTNARRSQSSTTFNERNAAGVTIFEATSTFDSESVILNPTTNASTSFGQGAFLVLGN